VLVTPLIVLSDREDGAVTWITPPGSHDLLVLFHDYFGATTAAAVLVAACALVALLPRRWGRGGADAQSSAAQPPAARSSLTLVSVALPLLLVPAGLLLAESVVAHPLYVDRYVLYGEAGAALLAGAGAARAGQRLAQSLARRRQDQVPEPRAAGQVAGRRAAGRVAGPRTAAWVLGAVLIAGTLMLQLGPQHGVRTPGSRLFDFGGPSRYIGAHARPGDGILYFGSFFRKAELGYPADYRGTRDVALAISPARNGSFQGTDKPAAEVVALMPRFRRIWVVGRAPSPQLPPGPAVPETRVLAEQYTLVAQRHFRGMAVTLWQRDRR
jgi:mannosyltransferase